MYIVYEFCGFRDLHHFLRQKRCGVITIGSKHIFLIAYQIASAFEMLHYNLIRNEADL